MAAINRRSVTASLRGVIYATGAALCFASVSASAPPDRQESVHNEVHRTLALYEQGLRQADLQSLRQAFADNGQFITLSKQTGIQARSFSEVLQAWITSPDPHAKLFIIDVRIAAPKLAAVSAKLRTRADCYDDQLLLIRDASRWRIVAKTTMAYPACVGWTAPTGTAAKH